MERLKQPVATDRNGFGLFSPLLRSAGLPLTATGCNHRAPKGSILRCRAWLHRLVVVDRRRGSVVLWPPRSHVRVPLPDQRDRGRDLDRRVLRETMLVNGKLGGEEKSSSEETRGRERAAPGPPPCSEKVAIYR